MKKITYKEAYDKIIEAYFKDEIKPMDGKFCICGTLAGGSGWISWNYIPEKHNYSVEEYKKLETALMIELKAERVCNSWDRYSHRPYDPDYEERLFNGMCAALEVLKQIHKERGEDVDGVQEFKKRVKNISG